ncbi:MAG: DUF1566 domain-containing protein [Desulfobacula sp.]|uniref:Lcl C-terminal domain-containing protein n=1 Tax=Desulfobacula sp. TaxID=2593537 RepID=UPI0025BD3B9C|nr:DUF1566 domain-containing protein [Desulfobacula sp.]MCD4718345.1 DUF1566 domain-containing protein [Desulfobacula sp.]
MTVAVFITMATFLPSLIEAGSLEPTDSPGPTMKTLNEIPPTWSQKLDSTNGSTTLGRAGCGSSRFECIWYEGSPISIPQAVLDKETGLVWERSPSSDGLEWNSACVTCIVKKVGGRFGWRLPNIQELFSLFDDTTDDHLPEGHPFINISLGFWSSSTIDSEDVGQALALGFNSSGSPFAILPKYYDNIGSWCVRGGNGYDNLKP